MSNTFSPNKTKIMTKINIFDGNQTKMIVNFSRLDKKLRLRLHGQLKHWSLGVSETDKQTEHATCIATGHAMRRDVV